MSRRFKKLKREEYSISTLKGPIAYSLARSYRRRTMEIHVTPSCEVSVFAPSYTPEREIRSFIREKADWIRQRLKEEHEERRLIKSRSYDDGHQFLFLGCKYPLCIKDENVAQVRVGFDGSQWNVIVPKSIAEEKRQALIKDKLIRWYRAQAKEIMGGRVFHFSRIMEQEPQKIMVRTQKRIWGSCDHRQRSINLNWYLVMAPMDVIDYVVVHELCHFDCPNHSRRYWKKVEKVLPDYRKRQKWLKDNTLQLVLP